LTNTLLKMCGQRPHFYTLCGHTIYIKEECIFPECVYKHAEGKNLTLPPQHPQVTVHDRCNDCRTRVLDRERLAEIQRTMDAKLREGGNFKRKKGDGGGGSGSSKRGKKTA
jgi:hypothetical protein